MRFPLLGAFLQTQRRDASILCPFVLSLLFGHDALFRFFLARLAECVLLLLPGRSRRRGEFPPNWSSL